MFDGADKMVKEGFDPSQVSLILQNHFECKLGAQYLSEDEGDYISTAGLKIHEELDGAE